MRVRTFIVYPDLYMYSNKYFKGRLESLTMSVDGEIL
jgi:hypothetical protein